MASKTTSYRRALECQIDYLTDIKRSLLDEVDRIGGMVRLLETQLYELYPEEDV